MYRILVADDEPIERQVVTRRIEKNFPQEVVIYTAQNGREAIDCYEREHCQIAILDIAMPGLTGLDAAKVIHKAHPDSLIIFLTAYDEFDYARQAIGLRALDYLLKPGKDEELQAALEEAFSLIDSNRRPVTVAVQKEMLQDKADNRKQNHVAAEITEFIGKHYMEDISLQYVAGEMGYSEVYFCTLFKNCFDKTFIMYLNELRINKAIELLNDFSISIKDISEKVGYQDANYFTRMFKKKTGMTPSEFRVRGRDHE